MQKSRFTIYQNLWSTDTDTNTKHDMDTDTPTPLIIWENDIIQCNYKCRCRVGVRHVRHVSATETRLIRGVSLLHRSKPYYILSRLKLTWRRRHWSKPCYMLERCPNWSETLDCCFIYASILTCPSPIQFRRGRRSTFNLETVVPRLDFFSYIFLPNPRPIFVNCICCSVLAIN